VAGDRVYQGDIKCECGKDAPIYLTAGGMLTYSCGWCRFQGHAAKGSPSWRAMQAKIKVGIDIDNDAPKMQTVEPPTKTQEKPKEVEKTIFDIFKTQGA
jgi:hypothetical protein